MKKVVSFLILLTLMIVVLMQPAVEAPAAPSHPIPVWSILCYLTVVILFAFIAARMIRGKTETGIIISSMTAFICTVYSGISAAPIGFLQTAVDCEILWNPAKSGSKTL